MIYAPFNGVVIPYAKNGDKINVGGLVASVVKESSVDLIDELDNLQRNNIRKQIEESNEVVFFLSDNSKSMFMNNFNRLINSKNSNDISDISYIRDNMNSILYNQAKNIKDFSNNMNLQDDIEEQKLLKQKINNDQRDVFSNISGVVSYYIDNNEKILTMDKCTQLNPEFINSLNVKQFDNSTVITSFKVEAGEAMAKVIDNLQSAFVFNIDNNLAETLEINAPIEILFEEINKNITGKIMYISEAIGGNATISVLFDSGVEQTLNYRKIKAKVIIKSYKGLKIPTKSLIDINYVDNTADIMIVKYGYSTARRVKILGVEGSYAIIECIEEDLVNKGIALYDVYLPNPINITEGQLIE